MSAGHRQNTFNIRLVRDLVEVNNFGCLSVTPLEVKIFGMEVARPPTACFKNRPPAEDINQYFASKLSCVKTEQIFVDLQLEFLSILEPTTA